MENSKVPIAARFTRMFAFASLMGLFLAAFLAVAQAASDDEGGQQPPFPDLTGKLGLWQAQTPLNIYWDNYHDGDNDGDSPSREYSTLGNELTSAGHTIVEKAVPITTSELSGFDVLILLDPEYAFSSAEISDIQTWVDDGHGLFIVGDAPSNFNINSVNELLNIWGIQFLNENTYDDIANSFNTHPVTTGVSTLELGYSGLLEGGTELGYSETGELVLSAYSATGKIVVLADSTTIVDDYIGNFDEITFLHNAVDWLAGPPLPPPVLRIDPTEMPPVTLRQDSPPTPQILTLHNDGEGPLRFKFRTEETTAASASWLTPDPISGSVPAGGSQEITLIYDASEQASGDYDADIIITSNDPENPEVTVPATLHVDPGLPGVMVPSPSSIEETLREGESSVHTLTLSNTGEGYLTYNLSLTQTSTAPTEYPILTEIPDGVGFRSDELIIKIAEGADRAEVALLRESLNATLKKTIEQLDIEVWNIPATDEPGLVDLIQELSANLSIGYAEPNYIQKAIGIPNDTRFDYLWGMHNTGQTGGTADADIDAVEAWDTFTGSHDVVVAVIDTGVDYNHVDLVDNRWVNEGEIPSNGVDDDGNGFVDDVYGYDFRNSDGDPMDGHSHGTHCSGTIGGVGNNSTGVAGVSHAVRIMAVKFLSDSGSGSTSDAIDSIIYAVDNGAQILSNSWGSGGFSKGLEDAISYANDHNVLFVAAAGNDGSNNDRYPHYPSNYEVPNVLAVAATNHKDGKPSWSNYGLTSVDLGAPGVDTLSTVPGNGYSSKSGTSMAAPHVSGAAALLKGYNPSLSALELKSILMESVDPVDSMDGITVTGGRLNINNALMMAGTPWITLEGELSGEIAPGGSVEVTVLLNAMELTLGDYTAEINVDSNDPVNPHQVVDVVLYVGEPIEFNCKNVTDISKKECKALVALYDSTDGANWEDNTGWKVTNTPCNWYGVTCKNGSVEKLELSSNNLNGSISAKFFKLKTLEILDLSYNEIDASILNNVKKLKNLETLWLNNCKLSGKFPNSLMKLKKLTDLDLYDNCLISRVSNKLGKWLDELNPGWDETQTNCLY
jgi:subtilisin family serine protease